MRAYLTELLTGPYQVPAPVDTGLSLAELGLDSLTRAEFGAEIQDRLGVAVEEDAVSADTTVDRLADVLTAKGAHLSS
ncbi:acyl carrier protein [Streptomyces argenteolus]|uniref:Acyl carrier protein n=1 Tax=Streptomyces argenteolus TaxID=67274 RepID=A0ABW6XEJ7_9ACTN